MASEDTTSVRVQTRLNAVEFADLLADLERCPAGTPRAGRIRLLLRLGLTAANSQNADGYTNVAVSPPSAGTVPKAALPRVSSRASSPLDALEALGMNPSQFQFGST